MDAINLTHSKVQNFLHVLFAAVKQAQQAPLVVNSPDTRRRVRTVQKRSPDSHLFYFLLPKSLTQSSASSKKRLWAKPAISIIDAAEEEAVSGVGQGRSTVTNTTIT
ncbi:hypothetical protein Hamer_G014125 [Homarus americanus]|uniref:Uncharacterized protein n=1 Tax=Homarus americanus TaxID=6706 RepID=A0A8J5JPG3_HOMAM|nr:hypothetical protein Hamer_G014125 [Homarus americanus]